MDSLNVVVPNDKCDLISDGERQNRELETSAGEEQTQGAEQEVCCKADWIFNAEGLEVGGPFEGGVDVIEHKCRREKAEKPAAPGEEVLFIAGVLGDFVGKEELRQEVIKRRKEDDEEIGLKVPPPDGGQAELPPPEMGDPKQERRGPAEVEQRGPFPAGMLDKSGKTGKQRGNAQADDNGDDDADVEIDLRDGGRRVQLNAMILSLT